MYSQETKREGETALTAEEIFEKTYAAYGPALYRFCLVQLGSSADAEDALQEVFCKRLYRAPDFASPEQERRWLFQVAANQCQDERKRRWRRDVSLDEQVPAQAPETGDPTLWEQVARLPEKLRAVIHLYYGEGYDVKETAAILGISVSAAKMRLKRGREALRSIWEAEE